jgi:hypothetical protein
LLDFGKTTNLLEPAKIWTEALLMKRRISFDNNSGNGIGMKDDPLSLGIELTSAQQNTAEKESVGFRFGDKGTHSSRTIMLEELSMLLRVSNTPFGREEYRTLILQDNCLGKRTVSTRRLTFQRLSELYALDRGVLLFRVMRQLWQSDARGRPLLALLLALARDPLLRITVPPIIRLSPGEELSREALSDALNQGTGSRFNEAILNKIVRNAASSWTQTGHLLGRTRKTRQTVSPTPSVVTFALLLGYALGARGGVLFGTLWAKILDTTVDEMIHLATDAKRLGYLDLKASGGVLEVSFSQLLTQEERWLIHGAD